jgi:peroxiredoxin
MTKFSNLEKQGEKPSVRLHQRLIGWVLQLIALLVILFVVHLWQTWDLAKGVAPPLVAKNLNGELVDLVDHTNWPVLIHFWATWCPVCGLESSAINDLSQQHSVVTVAMRSGSDRELSDYMRKHELEFTTINDSEGRLSSAWHVKGVPTSYIVDKDRNIRFISVGYTPELTLRFRLWLAEKIWEWH